MLVNERTCFDYLNCFEILTFSIENGPFCIYLKHVKKKKKVISKQMFFSKYHNGIFQEPPNFVPVILSWIGRRVNIISFPQFHFLQVFVFQWKVLCQKKKTTTTVIPHILDSNGVICLLHFTGYLKTNCTILVHHPFWHLSGKSCGRPYRARRQHSQWGVQIENTSSIVRSKISGDCPYAERLCSDLARGLLGAA